MWCTRWFLPLLLLPLPTAQPYFLVLFLFSLALHAKPCFYCVILLAALFLSSCYWQSFPLETRLSVPWSHNVTTFHDALNVTIQPGFDLHEYTLPPIIRVTDRCWCDFTSGMFEPYNMLRWERESVEKVAADLVKQIRERTGQPRDEGHSSTIADENLSSEETHPPINHTAHVIPDWKSTFSTIRSMFSRSEARDLPSMTNTRAPPVTTTTVITHSTPPSSPSPCGPLEYDLNPYGLDLVIDFHWSNDRRSTV